MTTSLLLSMMMLDNPTLNPEMPSDKLAATVSQTTARSRSGRATTPSPRKSDEAAPSVELAPIHSILYSDDGTYISGNTVPQGMIDTMPSGNGDITSALRVLPNVQYDSNHRSSARLGEIDPANISISGGLYYQNLFTIDGMSMNNDLNPKSDTNPVAVDFEGQSRSQGLPINTSLIKEIKVLDSNISAEYGGFAGGVIEAKTKRPTRSFGGEISYSFTHGTVKKGARSLTQYNIKGGADSSIIHTDEDVYNSYMQSTSHSKQPTFHKHILRSTLEAKVGDMGLLAGFNTTQSFIPLSSYPQKWLVTTKDDKTKVQRRHSYNLFLKAYMDLTPGMSMEASYSYMPQFNKYFIMQVKDSDFHAESGGHQLGLKTIYINPLGELTTTVHYNHLSNSRGGSADHFRGWHYSSEKNWNPNGNNLEGGYGNLSMTQNDFKLKVVERFDTFTFLGIDNAISTGFDLGYTYAKYERYKDMYFTGSAQVMAMKAGSRCTDSVFCSNATPTPTGGKSLNDTTCGNSSG